MKTNLSSAAASTSAGRRAAASKLAGPRSPKIENPKLNLEQANSVPDTRRMGRPKDSKPNRSLSGEEENKKSGRLSNEVGLPASDSSTAASTQSSSITLARKETNGEFLRNNRAKSFTPIALTSGSQLAAVLAQHKKLAAVGFQPDHEMIQRTIEVGTSKMGQANGPASTTTSHNTHASLTGSHPNSHHHALTLNTNAKNKFHLTNQTKNKRFANGQPSLEDQVQTDENNNELPTAEERKRQLYLRSPYLAQAIDSGKKTKTLDEYNKHILFGTNDANDSFELSDTARPEMPDSVADLLTRSAKAREPLAKPLAKPLNKQLISKRKAGQIKQDSFDSGTSSPTSSRSVADLKYGSPAKNTNKLATRNDFARTYALSSSQSPSVADRSASDKGAGGLVRSSTLTNLNTLAVASSKTPSGYPAPAAATNSILPRRPRSDYVNSKYSLLKSKSTHSLNKID